MQIVASAPTVVPATPERTYDKWWIAELRISGATPPVANMLATLRKFRTNEQGAVEFSPDPPVTLALDDLLGLAQVDPEIAAILQLVFAKLENLGLAEGVV